MTRRMRWWLRAAVAGLVLGCVPAAPRAAVDRPDTPQEASAAAYALKVGYEMERQRLTQALEDYAAAETRREQLRDRVSSLYSRLGAAVRQEAPAEGDAPEDRAALEVELVQVEQGEAAVRQEMMRLREKIADARERMSYLNARLGELKRVAPDEPEGISGAWEVTYVPSNDKAVFSLRQSGVIISGEYQQDGGFRGSLQGTLINNKLVLHRIDSKLGPISDLEGVVSTDQKSVKGTWTSRVIGDGTPPNGAWTARKRDTRRKPDDGAP